MYPSHLGPGDRVDFVEPSATGPILGYSPQGVAALRRRRRRDTRSNAERVNLYGYVANNPIRFVDPSGLEILIPPLPEPPTFPAPGKEFNSIPNAKRAIGFNCCIWPTSKANRLKPIPGVGALAGSPPVGPNSGQHKLYGWPSDVPIGGGGAAECIVLVMKCPDGVAVYHFTAGDNAYGSLGIFFGHPGTDWTKCHAIICGGENTFESNCLADAVRGAVALSGATLDGISGASNCGVKPDGTWYEK